MKLFIIITFISISFLSLAQTKISKPIQKDLYTQGYYNVWVKYMAIAEKRIANPNSYWHHVERAYFNRFLIYAKMQTNESREVLAVFMDGYKYGKHYFCHQYETVLPLKGDEYDYLWKMYSYEKPIMDELCNCVRNSYDTDLISKLKSIEEKDQRYRGKIGNSITLNQLKKNGEWKKQLDLDANNFEEIKKIINKIGYPGRSKVGYENEAIAFLVIQHSNINFMEKCLPLVHTASKNHELKTMYYAYLYDRIKMLKGEPQLYGTQYDLQGKLHKIKDIENVNERRSKIGLLILDL
jgi:hypothetical protein